MVAINPKDVNKTVDYIFGGDFDACHIVLIQQVNTSIDQTPHYIIHNPGDGPIEIRTLGVEVPSKDQLDLVYLDRFRGKKIRALKGFLAEDREIKILIDAGLIRVTDTITVPKIYEKNYSVKVYKWEKGRPVEHRKAFGLNADGVSMEALRAYIRLCTDFRCISCLKYPHGLIQYFCERYPNEIDPYREKGIDGYSDFKYKFLEEFENADSALALEAIEHDKQHEE